MQFVLSNYGHRYLQNLLRSGRVDARLDHPETRTLGELLVRAVVPCEGNERLEPLVARGFVRRVGDEVTVESARLGYARNPLEHVERVVFEYTTLCNLDCQHCRNGNLEATHEARPDRLRRVIDAMTHVGVARFDFIGGEVTLYGKGWLALVEHARSAGAEHVAVITSGWFLGERDFLAAGERYRDDVEYLAALRARGLTHVVLSLDGPAEVHDRWRQVPGLYDRVLEGLEKVRAAGMQPRVSLVANPGLARDALRDWMGEVAARVYGRAHAEPQAALDALLRDDGNYVSNFIDVGGAVRLRRSRRDIAAFSDAELRCKNFFRPSPTFRVKASGEVSLCPLVDGGDGYGNVHERDVVDIANTMHEALVFKLHAEGRIGEYRLLLDPALFGGHVDHVCTLRTALNMLARTMETRGVGRDDVEGVRAANREVAERMGFAPRVVKHRANGHARSSEQTPRGA